MLATLCANTVVLRSGRKYARGVICRGNDGVLQADTGSYGINAALAGNEPLRATRVRA